MFNLSYNMPNFVHSVRCYDLVAEVDELNANAPTLVAIVIDLCITSD